MANPPPYEEAAKGSNLISSPEKDAPPTYEQLFGISDLREAKRESANQATFAVKFCEVISGTIACAVCMVLLSALPVSMIIIGSVYFDDCRGRKNIPIWLIVFGCVSIVQSIIDIVKRCFKRRKNEDDDAVNRERYAGRSGNCLESLLSFFLFIWIIIGSSWVFGYYNTFRDCRNDDSGSECCHDVPYLFSFVTLIVIYSASLLICCCCCFMFCCAVFIGGAD